jgi:hypothetical protein
MQTALTDDLRFQEWKECRSIIARLDTILVDLRKVGFSLITGLLTASAFLNFLGVPTAQGVPAPATDVSAAVFIMVMVLVAALFSVDTYYQVLLSGAVERTLDLEAETQPPIRVTRCLSRNAIRSGSSFIIVALYIVLLVTAEGMGIFAAKGTNNLAFASCSTWDWVPWVGIKISAVGFIAAVFAFIFARRSWSLAIMVFGATVLLPAFTIALAVFLLGSPVADPHSVQHWIVTVGMFLAIYIQFYWLYCAWRSGLYRHKARNWSQPDDRLSDRRPVSRPTRVEGCAG